jgi:hypothetical protein
MVGDYDASSELFQLSGVAYIRSEYSGVAAEKNKKTAEAADVFPEQQTFFPGISYENKQKQRGYSSKKQRTCDKAGICDNGGNFS